MNAVVKTLRTVVCVLTLLLPTAARADETMTFIRDAEIEAYLRELATPIYRAADIPSRSVSINIVRNGAVNAFVAEGMNEFFYTGLLQLADTPEQLAGVIAHETGHIAGGHLIRGKEEMKKASAEAVLGMLLAVAAGAATGSGDIAMGGVVGSQQIVQRSFLSFSRAQESSADAAAMNFLDRAQMSSRGLLEFFRKLAGQELLPADRREEYVRTHPMTQDRIEAVQQHLDQSPLKDTRLPDAFTAKHERMKAKLLGFLQPETALLRYTDHDPRLPARYARAIALYRTGATDRALVLIEALIKEEPANAFFYELKAQVQFENGRIEEAIANYKRANELQPDSALLHQAYGHALLEGRSDGRLDLAIQQLLEANRLEERIPGTWRFLAAAWGRKAEATGDQRYAATATYALAEEAAAMGRDRAAAQYADRAMKGLPKGSAYWLRAQDIKLSSGGPENDKDKPDRRHKDDR